MSQQMSWRLVYKICWCDGRACYKVAQLFLALNIENLMSAPTEQELKDLAEELGACMKDKGVKLASAESCTGGWLAKIITDIPGSSEWFTGSVVCYSNESKMSLLDVKENTLTNFGAVSGDTVIEMVDGLFEHTNADVAVGISGIAGPDGGTDEKPVGLVWLSWGKRDESVYAKPYNFEGNREDVRKQSIAQMLNNLLDLQVC
jgi:nicotinamide-nucleotide amidase